MSRWLNLGAWASQAHRDPPGAEVRDFQRTFHPDGRLEKFGRPLPPFSSVLFSPDPGMLQDWDNDLVVQLTGPVRGAEGDIIIDEVEVVAIPG